MFITICPATFGFIVSPPSDFLWKLFFLTEIINEKGMLIFSFKKIILHNHLILNFV